MNATSQAELFFKSIPKNAAKGFKFLEDLAHPASQSEENEWRDFKEAKPLTSPPNSATPPEHRKKHDQEIKKLWSENIGAFANSGGGVLIWGIKAPKKFAEGTSLAADAEALANRLLELANDSVDPPVLGIQVRAFPRSKSSPEGFVVCFIPPSRHAPHRSKFAEREYYIRAQDGNVNCQTAVLRRLFYPTSSPHLIPAVYAEIKHDSADVVYMVGTIQILNRGQLSASNICVSVMGGIDLHIDNNIWDQPLLTAKQFWCRRPIHPDQDITLTRGFRMSGSHSSMPASDKTEQFRIEIFTSDAHPVFRNFSIPWGELKNRSDMKHSFLDYGEDD